MNNKFFRRGLSLSLSALLCVCLVLPVRADGEAVSLTPSSIPELTTSTPLTAAVSLQPGDGAALAYSWSSSDRAVVSVSETGETAVLSPVGPGSATVSCAVTLDGISLPSAACSVTVPNFKLNADAISVDVRKSVVLTPNLGNSGPVTWKSGSTSVATVDGSGRVTGVSAGTTSVTATLVTAAGATLIADCAVTVKEVVANPVSPSVTVSGDNPLSFSSVAGGIAGECSRVLGASLSHITGLFVPASSGTLYYGYVSEGEPGSGVGSNENYYASGSRSDRQLSEVTFVPKSDFSGTAVIRYTGYDASGKSFQGTVEVRVSAASGISYSTTGRNRLDFNETDFGAVCRSATGHELQYVSFSLPSASKGTLFYKYSGSDLDNKVTSGTPYYRSKSPLLSDVTFVAAEGYSGTLSIPYTGRDANGNSFGGSVTVTVSSSAGGSGSIRYSTAKNREAEFDADNFDDLCEDVLGFHLNYVSFTLPSSDLGTLYYNYTSSSSYGSKVSASASYYRTSYPYLNSVSFVPASGWTGTVDIAFTGYGTNGQRFTGAVTVVVDSSSSSGSLSYSAKRNVAVRFDVDDFNDRCEDETGRPLDYVRFTLPSSSYGTLRYNYSSSSNTGSAVSASTSYCRSSYPYLDNVYFVPASNWTGTVEISFTGYGTNGQRFNGSVRVTIQDSAGGGVSYSTKQNVPVNFSADDFDQACRDETGRGLNYVRFTLPSSALGTLRYNYSSSGSTGSEVSASTSYYRSSSPYLSNITFVPASGWSGTASIDYTGYDTGGQRYTGAVRVEVKPAAAAGVIYYTVAAGKSVAFDVSAFQLACSARGAGTFVSAAFSQSSFGGGQLRYQYLSADQPGTAVSSGAVYSASASPLVSNLSFVSAAGYTGKATLPYTGRDSGGATYSGSVVVTVTSDAKFSSFTDMGNYNWASAAVEYLHATGVVSGTGSGAFSPGASITRGSFMLMLNRAFQFTASGGPGFADVPENSVYADAVKIAQSLGIAQGSGSSFYPTQPLSRQQAAVFLARAMRASGWNFTPGTRSDLSAFSDSAAVSDYAAEDLAVMVRLGVFQGGSDGRLHPLAPLTRAQMAVILCRAITL